MESGHSQMECNSVHSAIEKVKNNVLIYAPMCYGIIDNALQKNPYRVHPMLTGQLLGFRKLSSI